MGVEAPPSDRPIMSCCALMVRAMHARHAFDACVSNAAAEARPTTLCSCLKGAVGLLRAALLYLPPPLSFPFFPLAHPSPGRCPVAVYEQLGEREKKLWG